MLIWGKEERNKLVAGEMADVTEKRPQGMWEQSVPYFSVWKMKADDIPEAAALERAVFPDPWSETMLHSGMAEASQLYFCARAQNGMLAGYAAVMTVLDEGELLRIGVASGFRRQGVGAMLMEKVLQTASEQKLAFMLLEVRKGNAPAIRLYEKYGFVSAGLRKNYYQNPAEDALIMRKMFAVDEKLFLKE